MDKNYTPSAIEDKLYTWWSENNYFAPSGTGPTFSVVIPPPNVTGKLHMGHALNHTLQDIIVREKRLKGYRTLWLPGSDHAGIATQNVVEKQLKADNISRHDLGREAFINKIWEWKAQYGSHIDNQIKRLGDSVDWSRNKFTMDDDLAKAVRYHFVTLYNKGLIYRGNYIINWCPRCHTALSDVEVEHETKNGHLWVIDYPSDDGQKITIATTRPETLFGDMAVAVHPDDDRYKPLIGKTVQLPFCDRQIPVIADTHVDPDFGTGAVKVTPAHDPNDFEIGKRHDLEQRLIMDESGVMNENAPAAYQGLNRYACRKQLVTNLDAAGLLVSTNDHELAQGHCYRCHTVVEPYLSKQWFVNMKKLAKPAIDAVKSGDITFTPKRWKKLYFDWMENIKDWCISRQIWWGHRIPVWYHPGNPDEPIVCLEDPEDPNLIQDNDVLDTWFSSALWPFSTMGWPDAKATDLADFYPTSLLVTGYDIVTFWVSRMITMGLKQTDKNPFSDVYIHGLVRAADGKKMSKSIGNAIDPLTIIDQFGADALRFCLASQSTLGGQDIKFSEDKVEASRNFANKVWNASRFMLMSLDGPIALDLSVPPTPSSEADEWIISRFYSLLAEINTQFDTYNYAQAADLLWEFIWNTFCDWYVELAKTDKAAALPTLLWVLAQSLIVLHPFMPFITEEIWQILIKSGVSLPSEALIIASWPTVDDTRINKDLEKKFETIIGLTREIRNSRQQAGIAPSKTITVVAKKAHHTYLLKSLAKIETITTQTESKNTVVAIYEDIQVQIPLDGLIDLDKERQRIQNQRDKLLKGLAQAEGKLNNEGFLKQAPEHVIDKIKSQHAELTKEKDLLEAQLAKLQ